MTGSIQLDDVSKTYRPSEPIAGTAQWQSDKPLEQVELRLVYSTSGIGTQDVETLAIQRFDHPGASESRRFELLIPADIPWTFSGKHVSLLWTLELVEDRANLLASQALVISPTGAEIDLYAHADGNVET